MEFIESKIKGKSLESIILDKNVYGFCKKEQLLNVATQIYCAKTFSNINGHKESLMKTAIEEAKILIEMCN